MYSSDPKWKQLSLRTVAGVFWLSICSLALGQSTAVIEVDASKVQHVVPRTLYGTFLEPIGHSTYGGLWAQILENPSLEENLWSANRIVQMLAQQPELAQASDIGLPLPWESLDPSQGWRFEPRWGDAANSARSLLIMGLPEKQVGIRQLVYLPVHRTRRYVGSLYVKPMGSAKTIEVSFRRRNRPDQVMAKQSIPLPAKNWSRYEFSLELPVNALATREPTDFVVAVSGEDRVLIDQVFLFPADQIDGLNPEMVDMARALKTPLVRYGGNYTSGYHWRDGVGPVDKRVSMLNQSWGMPEYNHFGTDEFLRFCRLIGSQPQIALNLGTGTPEEAADWVQYVDQKWNAGSGGLWWELGNELWGVHQIGYPTLARIADRTREFSAAVRRVDPHAKLIATGQDPDRFQEWNAAQLALGAGAYNLLSTHFVVRTAEVLKPNASRDFIAQASLALPIGLEKQLYAMKQQVDANPKTRDQVKLAFTEWLFAAPATRAPMFDNLGGALCTAGFLNVLMRVADFTPLSDMTGLIEFGGIWQKHGRVYGVPAYWAFRMYSNADATKMVDSKVNVDRYEVEEGVRRLPAIPAVPYLDVVSALNDDGSKLTLFCVNRHLTQDIHASVQLSGFTASAARAQQLTATSLYTTNDDVRPDAIVPADLNLQIHGAKFPHVFPSKSVTVIELTRTK
jgi:alpha-N-arabinofuranosidase